VLFSSSPLIVTAPEVAGEALAAASSRCCEVTVAQADSARRITGMNNFMATPSTYPNVDLSEY